MGNRITYELRPDLGHLKLEWELESLERVLFAAFEIGHATPGSRSGC